MERDPFVACQESIVSELTLALQELKAGRYEAAYNRLTDLSSELIGDIAISKAKELDSTDRKGII